MFKKLRRRFWHWMFRASVARIGGGRGWCGNRSWTKFRAGNVEVEVIWRDETRPDAYSREELVRMLRTVRAHEVIQGWRVPEQIRVDIVTS